MHSMVVATNRRLLQSAVHVPDLVGVAGLDREMLDAPLAADAVEDVREHLAIVIAVRELNAVVGENSVDRIGAAATRLRRNRAASTLLARGINSAQTNAEVQSIAPNRENLPSSVRTSAI